MHRVHENTRSYAFPFVQAQVHSIRVTATTSPATLTVPTPHSSSPDPLPEGLSQGEPGYRRASLALLAAGLASFNALYCTQALMPTLTSQLGATPAQASLTVSAATGILAITILPVSVLSERFGRGRLMTISAMAAVIVGLLLPLAPSLGWLVAGRGLQGLLVAGVPATAMAWLSQEIHPRHLPRAMGLYVAGNTVGGLLGRLIPSGVLQFSGWRPALGIDMAFALVCTVAMVTLMPAERRFVPKQLRPGNELRTMGRQWADRRLAGLFGIGFIFMGVFVSLYDFLGYRLTARFGMPPSLIGLVFLLYLFGTLASARAGHLTATRGRSPAMLIGAAMAIVGMPLVASGLLWLTLPGVALFTYGFFTVHSVASGWVGALAPRARGEASGTYLACYYLGSSILGYLSGHVMHAFGWTGLVMWLVGLILIGCALSAMVVRSARS